MANKSMYDQIVDLTNRLNDMNSKLLEMRSYVLGQKSIATDALNERDNALRESQTLRADLKRVTDLLYDLLMIVHRDNGGLHISSYGLEAATQDAIQTINWDRYRLSQLQEAQVAPEPIE